MTITISSEDPRSVKAIDIAAGAGQWLKCHTADGRKAYGIPSQCFAGRYYLVDAHQCDCPDARRRPGQACKHVLAVRLHCELVKAQKPSPRPHFVVSHVNSRGEVVHLPARIEVAQIPNGVKAIPTNEDERARALWRRFETD